MPDQPAGEKTEEATPERLRKAKEEGKLPESKEVGSALMLTALLIVLFLTAGGMYDWLVNIVRRSVSFSIDGPPDGQVFLYAMKTQATGALLQVMPFLIAAFVASIFGSLISSGWAFSPKAVGLKVERINPVNGAKNLFSKKNLVMVVISLIKLSVISVIIYVYLRDKMGACLALGHTTPEGALVGIADLVFGVMIRLVIGLIVIAIIDLLYQRWKYKKDQMMTRQEVKEERKQYELPPEVRGKIRSIQIEMARKRMLQEVPDSDVVIVNPTHVAVALKYDQGKMRAPEVIAKGPDLLCEKIKEIARANNIPIVQRPELARALYHSVEPGDPVPETLFVAVAEVLAMIYRLKQKKFAN